MSQMAGANDQNAARLRRILVVEDNDLNLKLFRDLLIAQGYSVIHTRDGVEAFRLARTHTPDLILMDIQLPEVSGFEVTRWLKDDPGLRDIPVVAVTAFAMAGDEEKARVAGCAAYVTKPIAVKSFLETVAKCLGQPQLEPA
jgi:two-component system, cell cycle response regulator DivK